MSKVTRVDLDLDYVQGHLRYGHFEAELAEKELEEFKKMSDNEQINYIKEVGELIIDDFEVDDYGEGVIKIYD